MATLNKLIYNLRNSKRGGILADDDKISNRQLAFVIGYYRAMILQRKLKQERISVSKYEQTLSCVEMVCVDRSECCELPTGCLILRSKIRLPKTINWGTNHGVTFVGLPDFTESYQFVSESQARWSMFNKFTGKLRKAYFKDGYIYITNNIELEVITVRGLFEDPVAAAELYKDCDPDIACASFDDEYPMEEAVIPMMNDMIFKNEMSLLTLSPEDTRNDTRQQPEEQKE